MRLTNYSTYALRMLMMAAAAGDRLCTTREMAGAFGISHAHLNKCVFQLGRWGYLENVRGRGGGFRLARPADRITVGEILRKTEDTFELVECFEPVTNTCPLLPACRLGRAYKRALARFMDELDNVTIADVAANGPALWPLLEVDASSPGSDVRRAATARPMAPAADPARRRPARPPRRSAR